MLKDLWARITGRRRERAEERADEFQHMSPEERRFVSESVDDRAAELESEAHLGGGELED
jgi:hypothetical protein